MNELIHRMFMAIEKEIPAYMQNPADSRIANGNVAVCIIDEAGQVYGKMFGDYRPRQREIFKIAWTKASQVWLTGIKTGEYERLVFTNEIAQDAHGIEAPDLIGWEGGQQLLLADGSKLAVGFSGFRGVIDIEIMIKALEAAQQ
jgi:uncharacterized protein GlcG (DUF336 family)